VAKRTIERIDPFLTFQGRVEEALALYADAFPTAKITGRKLYGKDDPGNEGKIQQAVLEIGENRIRVFDGPMVPGFHFSSAFSFYVEINGAARLDAIAGKLGKGGEVKMELGEYAFAERYTWLADKFGVNWQLVHGPK
jgi:predicted 3-demethylubiquinone-9 3-methyltransferase (glyoxalase superfamily)